MAITQLHALIDDNVQVTCFLCIEVNETKSNAEGPTTKASANEYSPPFLNNSQLKQHFYVLHLEA